MDNNKLNRLKSQGWEVGNTANFLELSQEEIALIDFKIALIKRLKELRIKQNLSQESLAKKIKSSQSRIAKIEAGEQNISLDLILKTMFSLGATNQDLIEVIKSLN